MSFKNIGLILVGVACLYTSCKKDEKKEGTEPIEPQLVKVGEFRLSNQYDSFPMFDAKKMEVIMMGVETTDKDYEENDENVYADNHSFDFAFAHYDTLVINNIFDGQSSFDYKSCAPSTYPKYYFGAPSSKDLKRSGFLYKCKRKTTFYDVPYKFTYAHFDTLTTVAGIKEVIALSETVTNNGDMSSDSYFSDAFGWSDGTVIGFKTQEGKCGLIKIIGNPETYDRRGKSYIKIKVKFEGE